MQLGRADKHRQQTLVFFPGLIDSAREDSKLTPDELAKWYDRCVHPALNQVAHARIAHWPSTYAQALKKCRDNNQRLHYISEAIPEEALEEFAELLQEKAAALDWGDIFFVHELRGVKNQSDHDVEIEGDAVNSWDSSLQFLDVDQINEADPTGQEQWYIDVALEVTRNGGQHVLQWYENCREDLLRIGLPNASDARIEALAKNSLRTKIDTTAQLFEFAGFRSTPGKLTGRNDKVKYLNVYTTDKDITYTAHHLGPYSRHRAQALFPQNVRKLLDDVHEQANTFRASAGQRGEWEGWSGVQSGGARYEVRVALSVGQAALQDVTVEQLRPYFATVFGPAWW